MSLVGRALIFGAAVLWVTVAPTAQSASGPMRSVYVSVLDNKGLPVTDLTMADVALKEDGKARPVVSFAPAKTKFTVVMLVDDSGLGLNDIRMGVARFLNRLIDVGEFSIIGIAGQNRTLVGLTSEGGALGQALQDLRAREGPSGGYLLEGVMEAMTTEERGEAVRPVIVIVTNQANEHGNPDPDPVMQRLVRTRTALYVVETLRRSTDNRGPAGSFDASAQGAADNEAAEADRARNKIMGDGPKETGGRREEVINSADIPAVLDSIAVDLANQYLLTYEPDPKAGATPKIAVSTTRKSVKVRAPARSASGRRKD